MTGYESKKAAAQDKLAQPAQEAVAWCPVCGDKGFPWPKCGHITYLERATPPQRTWVDLTDTEIDVEANKILTSDPVQWWRRLARAVLAKSKEKNNG